MESQFIHSPSREGKGGNLNIKPSHFIIGFLSLFITSSLLSSSKFTISGFVTDKQTGKPIPDANIVIINTNLGTASKDGGYYYINNIAPGTYAIMVSVIGYDKVVQSGIRLQADHILNFTIQPKAIDVSPVMITATLSEHLLSKITVSSDVLTQLHIQDLNGNTTGEIIESVGGLFSKTFDGFAGVQTPSIRGSNADQILVLMDGMRLNTAQGGGVDLNLMPLATLERIEVVRGGHSALLGSDAVGGTIHLLTKNSLGPKKSSYGFNSTLGSFGTRIININGSQKWRALSLFFNYNHTQTDGNFNFIPPDTRIILTRKNNDFKGNNIFTKTIWDISPLHKIQIQYQNFQTEKGSAGSVNVDPWTEERMITPKARSNNSFPFNPKINYHNNYGSKSTSITKYLIINIKIPKAGHLWMTNTSTSRLDCMFRAICH